MCHQKFRTLPDTCANPSDAVDQKIQNYLWLQKINRNRMYGMDERLSGTSFDATGGTVMGRINKVFSDFPCT